MGRKQALDPNIDQCQRGGNGRSPVVRTFCSQIFFQSSFFILVLLCFCRGLVEKTSARVANLDLGLQNSARNGKHGLRSDDTLLC